jgi:hypothetical protein
MMKAGRFALVLLLAVASVEPAAITATEQETNARSPEAAAAFCLGEAEASLTELVAMIQRSSTYPTFDATPLKRAAAATLLTIQRLARHLESRGQPSDADDSWAVLQARQQGIHLVEQCFHDQFTTYVPCQTACQQRYPTQATQDECSAKCELPASCKLREQSCDLF